MELKKAKSRHRRIVTILSIFFGIIAVGFLSWIGISIATSDNSLDVVNSFKLPELSSIDELPDYPYGDYAVALDSEIMKGTPKGDASQEPDNTDVARPTASTAKMILALAIMQKKPFTRGEKGEMITISQEMFNQYLYYVTHGGSNTRIMLGEEISEYDALASVLMASSNNMADALAIWAFGSIDGYRDYATKMLNEWGISSTTIGIDACGFDESTTSTAEDLARIGAKLMAEPTLAEIVATKSYTVPVAGTIDNTNLLLGQNSIEGVKTGFIGDASGYCLVLGYRQGEHIVTTAQLGFPTRQASFDDGKAIIEKLQNILEEQEVIRVGDVVGYYNSWWTGPVEIKAKTDLGILAWKEADIKTDLAMDGKTGAYTITVGGTTYSVEVIADEYEAEPSFNERLMHVFGWSKGEDVSSNSESVTTEQNANNAVEPSEQNKSDEPEISDTNVQTSAESDNCTIQLGALMLINPNFTVDENFIAKRSQELVSISSLYGIREGVAGNGDNLLDAEAATHINDMVKAYETDNPGHTLETRSCFRARGTNCGRLCAATGASDHHTGLTCDLIDPVYGTSLDTDTYGTHQEWQWLKANSYKYGFIDRFPEAWAGGPMSEPLNVDENGSTGLFETWHFRYVGIHNATEIATGKYNNGEYDSLEHYLKMRGLVTDLKSGKCK